MNQIATVQTAPADIYVDRGAFDQMWRAAKMLSESQLVPQHLRGKPADCMITIEMARQLGEHPLMVAQNITIVNGRAGWLTQYMIARANQAKVFRGRITWTTTGTGKSMSVTAKATLADTGEDVSSTADMAMAEAEGWTRNPKYKSMPEHMLRWRSATFLIRLYCPEVMLGIPAVDEIEDMRFAGTLRAAPDGSYEAETAPVTAAAILAQADGEDASLSEDRAFVNGETGEIIDAPESPSPVPMIRKPSGVNDLAGWCEALAEKIKASRTVDALNEWQTINEAVMADAEKSAPKAYAALMAVVEAKGGELLAKEASE